MKLQDFIMPLALAYLTIWSISYFWGSKNEPEMASVRSGQEFSVMRHVQMCYPVNMEVDFNDAHKNVASTRVEIDGYHSQMTFISGAGALEGFNFQRNVGGVEHTIATLVPPRETDREKAVFLVALSGKTPYNFELIKNEDREGLRVVTYQSVTNEATITKEFTIYPTSYQIDLALTVEPTKGTSVMPRLFVPGPFMQELADHEKVAGVVFTERESFKKLLPDQTVDVAWASPKMFGVEDRYFASVMIADKEHFTQRAYFKRTEGAQLSAIFEGPEVTQKTSWTLSFYCGPKELRELARVNDRLDELMDYGWLAPVSKLMLSLLNFVYSYVGNYGWAIIIMTLLMRLVLFPFVRRGNQQLKRSSEFSQKMKYIEQKYKDDPEALQKAKLEVARKYGLSPLSGCLPLLLQIPVFIGLNFALRNAIELYHAPFILWIKDLSAPDPYYILPAGMALSLFLILSSSSKDPRYKVFAFIFSLVAIGFSAYISAGLGLFICVSSMAGLFEKRFLPAPK